MVHCTIAQALCRCESAKGFLFWEVIVKTKDLSIWTTLCADELWDRFWSKVRSNGKCWEWVGHRNLQGYGVTSLWAVSYRAHRISYTLAYGKIPSGGVICHSCDNPCCVNPDHLRSGTVSENNRDTRERGRFNCGPDVKLTESDVVRIRERFAGGESAPGIAKDFDVYPSYVVKIVTGQRKRDMGGPITKRGTGNGGGGGGGRPRKA